jgi:glutamate synthase domain-containing protein 3
VVILGEAGRNFAAGMTGGTAFVWDQAMSFKGRLAETAPPARRPSDSENGVLRGLVEEHLAATSSPIASDLIGGESGSFNDFWVISAGEPLEERSLIALTEVPLPRG